MKGTNEESVKYCFTKYVEVALGRCRKDFLKKRMYYGQWEIPMEPEMLQEAVREKRGWNWYPGIKEIPWDARLIRAYLKDEVADDKRAILAGLSDREVLVVFARVFWELSYAEIGAMLGVSGEKATSIYSYAKKKMKKGRKDYEF